MKKVVFIFLLLLGLFPMASCNSEQEFNPIELSTDGIDFIEVDRLTLSADIPNEGISFSITGIGKYADRVCVNDVTIDGLVQNDPSIPIISLSGDWGCFNQKDNTIIFKINPNTNEKSRVLDFTIGGGYWVRYLSLTQKAK